MSQQRGGSYESVLNALSHRVWVARLDLITTYGVEAVTDAIEDKASEFESYKLEEIGSSDVSCWILDIEETLKRLSSSRTAV